MQARVGLGVVQGFVGFGDHHVALAFGDQRGDLGVLVVRADLGGLEVGQHIGFVGAAGVLDDAHGGLVHRVHAGVFGLVGRAHQGHFAERGVAGQHVKNAHAVDVAGDAAHGHVKLVALQVLHQVGPGGGHVFDLHAQLLGHGFDHVDVVAAVARVGLDGKRAVVAGRAHADDLGLHDLVEPWAGLCGLAEGEGGGHGGCGHGEDFLGDHFEVLRWVWDSLVKGVPGTGIATNNTAGLRASRSVMHGVVVGGFCASICGGS